MFNSAQLEASLNSLDGFKKIMKPFLFFFGGPKPGYEIWSKATTKKVVTNYSLAEFQYEDNFYQIMAFSLEGNIAPDKLEALRARAKQVPLGTVRYEAAMASSAQQLVAMDFADNDSNDIISLSDPENGLFVFPRPTDKAGQTFPLVLYAFCDGKHYYYPVKTDYLS